MRYNDHISKNNMNISTSAVLNFLQCFLEILRIKITLPTGEKFIASKLFKIKPNPKIQDLKQKLDFIFYFKLIIAIFYVRNLKLNDNLIII